MSGKGQEVRQTWVWDTTSVERGAKTIENAYDREKRAREQARKASDSHGAGGAGNGNISQGFRDLAEGRGVNAMQRFGHAIGANAARLSVYMMALKATAETLRYYNEQVDETVKGGKRLQDSFTARTAEARASSVGEGRSTLFSRSREMLKGRDEETEQQIQASHAIELTTAAKESNPFSRLYANAKEAIGAFKGDRTPEAELGASEMRGTVYNKEATKLRQLSIESMKEEVRVQDALNRGMDLEGSKIKEHLEHERERAEIVRQVGDTAPELKHLAEAFRLRGQTLEREQKIRDIRFGSAQEIAEIEKKNLSSYQERREITRVELAALKEQLDLVGKTDSERSRSLRNQTAQVQNQQRINEQDKTLKSDGRRKSIGQIRREERADRRETKLRSREDRRQSKIDPDHISDPAISDPMITNRTAADGLVTGNLNSGHIQSSKPLRSGRGPTPEDVWNASFERTGEELWIENGQIVQGRMAINAAHKAGGRSNEQFRNEFRAKNPRTLKTLADQAQMRRMSEVANEGEQSILSDLVSKGAGTTIGGDIQRVSRDRQNRGLGSLDAPREDFRSQFAPSGPRSAGGPGDNKNPMARVEKLLENIEGRLPKEH